MKQIKHLNIFFFTILFIVGTLSNTMHVHDIHEEEVHSCDICIVDHLNLSFDVIDKKPFIPLCFLYEQEEQLAHITLYRFYKNKQARAPPLVFHS